VAGPAVSATVERPLPSVREPRGVDDAALQRLYAVPPEEFVAVRNALAKELVQAGNRKTAEEVKSLRKPTVVVWALNRVARDHRDGVEALLDAGERLRRAQQQAMGGDAGGLRESRHALDLGVRDLARAAARVLDAAGRGSAGADTQILNTLRAAAVDEGVGGRLLSGCLAHTAEPPSFPSAAGHGAVPVEERTAPRVEAGGELREARRRLRQVEAEVERLAKHAERLVAAAQRARREADDAEAEARSAEEHLSSLRLEADEAASTVRELERRSG